MFPFLDFRFLQFSDISNHFGNRYHEAMTHNERDD